MKRSFLRKTSRSKFFAQKILRRFRAGFSLLRFKVGQKTTLGKRTPRLNLCSGNCRIPGYFNIDIGKGADLVIDLATSDLPFPRDSIQAIVCMSAINYFSRTRASELIRQAYNILTPGGVARFGVQDMEALARLYVSRDRDFFFQKGADKKDRFEGPTIGDKFAAWFYGYVAGGYPCQYFYDYESLAYIFKKCGFSIVERRPFRDSRLEHIELIDNRPEQMFFLEAVK